MSSIGDKMSQLLQSLPRDLATLIVFSGISLKPEKLAEAIKMTSDLNMMRILEEQKAQAALKAEQIVESTMTEFQAKLSPEVRGK